MLWMGDLWGRGGTGVGSSIASLMFLCYIFQQFVPSQFQELINKYTQRLLAFFNPYIDITIDEYSAHRWKPSEGYTAIQTYLANRASKQASRLKADIGKESKNVVFSMDENQEITDVYQGAKLWWTSCKSSSTKQTISFYPSNSDDPRYYKLTFHRKHKGLVTDSYLNHVLEVAKEIEVKSRQRKLWTNNASVTWSSYRKSIWSHVVFDHPSTFRTLAMEEDKKKEIIDDLTRFKEGKEYYGKIGKAWKRGYLLHGPPGTGKSTMIAAMANFLDYDIYDIELTAVKNNTELRKLLIETSNKSLIVIEDIDCSLDLTGQRNKKKAKVEGQDGEPGPIEDMAKEAKSSDNSKVTLSGLLNFIDGLWSACGAERIIVFTTNYVHKLDPALIRRGRMDKHIEMSYCSFGGFKVLAKNYLDLDSHHLFGTVERLLDEIQMTPADVAENLMPKTTDANYAELCLENLIETLKDAKEEARLKAEEEAKQHETSTKDESDDEDESPGSNATKENESGK